MKKILCLSLVLLMIIGVMSNVYAVLNCNISAQTSKDTFNKEEEFTIDFVVSNIQSERGIIAIGATLQYDKDSLTLVKMEGQNGWETPINEVTYNEANGEIAINKNGLAKSDETFLRITFKVNKESKENATITLSNIKVGDGIAPATLDNVTKRITISSSTTSNPSTTSTPTNNITPSTSNTQSTSKDSTVKNERLPQTGIDSTVLKVCIAVVVLATIGFYIRVKTVK